MPAAVEAIRLEHISKHFGGVRALDDVGFSVLAGEVHAVVGENGAGKSTLMKVLAGVVQPDHGEVALFGQAARIDSPRRAQDLGVSIVYQELSLFPTMTVTQNVFMMREQPALGILLDDRAMRRETQALLQRMGLRLDSDALVGALSIGEQQLVEIARVVHQQSQIIILDEPNSALSEAETRTLFQLIHRLKEQGHTVLYISHRMEEVFSIADRLTVLRDGRYVMTVPRSQTTIPHVIEAMIGRRLSETFPIRQPPPSGSPVVAGLRQAVVDERIGPIDLSIHAGEIVGLIGLEGSGVEDVFRCLFGLARLTRGHVMHRDQAVKIAGPPSAIGRGWGMIPANRRDEGLMIDWSVERNATLVIVDQLLNKLGLIKRSLTRRTVQEYVRQFGIATDSIDQTIGELSGGNQQKVVLAKWLGTDPRLLLLNDPTRGVDVGAKVEIYGLIDRLARQGMGILFTSSEAEEIVGLCDRVLVFYRGRIVKTFRRGEAPLAEVMEWVAGRVAADASA